MDTVRLLRIRRWLLEGQPQEPEGLVQAEGHHPQHPWWQVMCLTGVDYFSTLGYQPGIAALAAGALSPVATLILVLVTLFGALPIYRNVAQRSSHGEGSIAMLERKLSWWKAKLFVLVLLGFAATDFIITITLSSADSAAHVVENPFVKPFISESHTAVVIVSIGITLLLITLLGAVFLKGFSEAIWIAVCLVSAYLVLNFIVVVTGLLEIVQHGQYVMDWQNLLFVEYVSPFSMLIVSVLLFPKLALGMSGFETGVTVMPLVRCNGNDTDNLAGRVRNTHKLLVTVAVIMSLFLLVTSFITIVLIPREAFLARDTSSEELTQLAVLLGRPIDASLLSAANGRALAFLAHEYLGDVFGTVYDLSTIAILWFAGASAMSGLLNLIPRYLPRYGMAPEWARSVRPMVLVFTAIAFVVTLIFRANVEAQAGAYATGVLVLMTSAAGAVMLLKRISGTRLQRIFFTVIFAVFVYTLGVNTIQRSEGVKIGLIFTAALFAAACASRFWRSKELRIKEVRFEGDAMEIANSTLYKGEYHFITWNPDSYANGYGKGREAFRKLTPDEKCAVYDEVVRRVRRKHHIKGKFAILEVWQQFDSSEFTGDVTVRGRHNYCQDKEYDVLKCEAHLVPNTLVAIGLELRRCRPQNIERCRVHFNMLHSRHGTWHRIWEFVLFGRGNNVQVAEDILRSWAEKHDPSAEDDIVLHAA